MKLNLTSISYTTAISLAAFSGGVATFGMMKLVPGAESSSAPWGSCSRPASSPASRCSTVAASRGSSGSRWPASAWRPTWRGSPASCRTRTSAYASLIERQLASAESNLAEARTALIKARDDRGRQRAAQAVVTSATAERDALVQKLSAARGIEAQVEGTEIGASGEFAAVAFLAAATGTDQDEVAHLLILVIAS